MRLALLAAITHCVQVVRLFPKKVHEANLDYMRSYKFLFSRLKPRAHWFVLVTIFRNCFVAVAPVITPDVPANQIALLYVAWLLTLGATVKIDPWRVQLANALEIICSAGIVVWLVAAAFHATSSSIDVVANACLIMFFCHVGCAGGWALLRAWLSRDATSEEAVPFFLFAVTIPNQARLLACCNYGLAASAFLPRIQPWAWQTVLALSKWVSRI